MKLIFYILIVILIIIYVLINYYVGLRGWQGLFSKMRFLNRKLYWALFWICPSIYFISRFTAGILSKSHNLLLTLIGYYWIAALMYFLIAILIIDFIRFVYRTFFKGKHLFAGNNRITIFICSFTIVSVISILVYGSWNASKVRIVKYNISIDKQAGTLNSLHAVMVSDVHLGEIAGRTQIEKMVAKINALNPDIVIIAGDLIDAEVEPLEDEKIINLLSQIKSVYGVYAVPGNHEIYSGDLDAFKTSVEKAGIHLLIDECVNIDNSFYIAGRNDFAVERFNGEVRKSLGKVLDKTDITKPVIIADHQPGRINEAYEAGADILLSGHTHKGQIFPGNLITNAIFENDYGYLKKGGLSSIVSSGYGTWGPPLKIGSNSEIVDIDINFK